ncbi:MAG: Crp/Fnr family transcriptional regulator [Propionibacteriaceae bacterium]|nr:Crp/Fnr family transcriptional regulator [Propionibacteriaceae bacterium]
MRLDALRMTTIRSELNDSTLRAMRQLITPLDLERGHVIFRTGDEPDGMYSVYRGKVKLFRRPQSGVEVGCHENLIHLVGDGQCFGELSVLDPGPRNTTAVALTPCRLHFLPREHAERLVAECPDFSRAMLHAMARRLRLAQNETSSLVLHDVPGRVARAILLLATRFGEYQRDGSIQVRHDITQSEIASMIGASREAVNKAMTDFANRQWVILRTKSLVVLDRDRLRVRAGAWPWDDNPLNHQLVGAARGLRGQTRP